MERNPMNMSNPEMSDLSPEVLEIIFNGTDLTTKKELRLVCKSWQQIIDRHVVNFCIRSMRTLSQLNTFLDSPAKEFSLVKMEFTWGVKFPKYLLKDGHNFNTHKIKELVFAKPSYKRYTVQANTRGELQLSNFFNNFLKSGCHGVDHLNIQSEIMENFIVSDLERALSSSVPWNTVKMLSLTVKPTVTDEKRCPNICFAPLTAFLKLAKVPNLNNVRFKVRSAFCSGKEIHRSTITALIVDICKFFLRYKQTLRHIFLLFEQSHHTLNLDLEKHLNFMEDEGPLHLESFVLEMPNAISDAFGYIATVCTDGPTKLGTFGYSSCNNQNHLATGSLIIANERLERILSQNGSTLEDLTLDMLKVNFNLFRHCPNLKTLKFGDVHEMSFQEWSSKFPNITRLKIQNECFLKPEFLNWLLAHCPDLTFLEIRTPWNDFAHRNPLLFVSIQSILLTFDKLKEILLFEQPHMFPFVETQSQPEFECVRKINPSTTETYLSILVRNHNM